MKPFIVLALVTLAAPAAAQQVVFQDGFENGLSNWTPSGLWNLEDAADPCAASAAPFAEGTKAAWYGIDGACDFDDGTANSGGLSLNTWLTLPDAPSINLRFWMWSETEYCWGAWDVHSVRIQAQNGPDAGFVQDLCPTNGPPGLLLPWHERRIDLSAYRGAQVHVTFQFHTNDGAINDLRGWFVDDVRILAEPGERVCPTSDLTTGCPCAIPFVPVAGGCRNSTQQSATLLSGGVARTSADSLVFTADHMPPGTLPTLFQGTTQAAPAFFGDGLRCIGGNQLRLGTHVAPTGSSSWPATGTTPLSVLGQVPAAGDTRYYQVIYRNAASYCTPNTFNLTDAQRVVWLP